MESKPTDNKETTNLNTEQGSILFPKPAPPHPRVPENPENGDPEPYLSPQPHPNSPYPPPPIPNPQPREDIVKIFNHPPLPLKPGPPSFRPAQGLPFIKSYDKLFPRTDDDHSWFPYDKYALLLPFNKRCYATNATFTIQDLHKYSWLLAQSEERWYTMPTVGELAEMRKDGLKELQPIEEPKPAGLDTPCIVIGEALTLDVLEEGPSRDCWGDCENLHPDNIATPEESLSLASGKGGRSECSFGTNSQEEERSDRTRMKWACQLCYDVRNRLFDEIGWVYLSVVRTEVQGVRSSQGNGMGMFMLKKHGSREAAAATAFCDAGVRGWSTVFSCAMRADVELLRWKGEWRQTNQIEKLLVANMEGVLTVWF